MIPATSAVSYPPFWAFSLSNQKQHNQKGEKEDRDREMGDDVRKCTRKGGIAAMEGVRKRARKAERTSTSKRRKIVSRRLQLPPSSSSIRLQNLRCLVNSPENLTSPDSPDSCSQVVVCSCSSSCSDPVTSSRSSSNDSNELVNHSLRSVDLEAEGFETENSKFTDDKFSRETTPSSELCGDSEELESPAKPSKPTSRRRSPGRKMPTDAEIEEFFSEAEKYEAKRFAENYNYDIVKDVPLEGRYQWVRLKP